MSERLIENNSTRERCMKLIRGSVEGVVKRQFFTKDVYIFCLKNKIGVSKNNKALSVLSHQTMMIGNVAPMLNIRTSTVLRDKGQVLNNQFYYL